MRQVKSCLWCDGSELEPITTRKDGTGIVKCNGCGLFMNSTLPDDLSDYYQEGYFNSSDEEPDMGYSGDYSLTSPAFLLWQSSFISAVNVAKNKKHFLEIGSATGSLLEIVTERQPDLSVSGIDISKYAVDFSQKKGLKAEVAYIQELKSSPKKDIIFSSETLEHLDDLRIFLRGVKKNLQKDGVFMFYVPSIVEKDARSEGSEYVRFRTKMEHVLHFTPTFFRDQLPGFFGTDVVIREIVSGFGPCILGVVSADKKALKNIELLFDSLDSKVVPRSLDTKTLIDLTIMSLKFGKDELSQKLLKLIDVRSAIPVKDKSLIRGLVCYHSGELEKATIHFDALYKQDPGSVMALKLLYANQKELSKIYLDELYKIKVGEQVVSRKKIRDKVKARIRKSVGRK